MLVLPIKGSLQQWTAVYEISGDCDGVTLAPSAGNAPVDEEGVYRLPTATPSNPSGDIGIIDPDLLGGRGTQGDRFISFIHIEAASPIPVGFALSVVDATLASPNLGIIETRRITTPAVIGQVRYISTECTYVPQGQALRITGLPAPPPGQVHTFTIGVRAATTGDDEARLASACCCQSEAETGGAQPEPPAIQVPVIQSFDFSTELIAIAAGGDDAYFAFSAAFQTTDTELNITRNIALSIQPSQGTGPSASRGFIKMIMTPGEVTAMSVRTVTPFTAEPFVEIDPGTGVFARTAIGPATALAANTTTELVINLAVPFVIGDRIRAGLNVTVGNVNTALEATVQITTPVSA